MTRHSNRSRARLWLLSVCGIVVLVALIGLIMVMRRGNEIDETWESVHQRGVLRVGMDASYPPFGAIDGNGAFFGYDVDLARDLASAWGVEAQFVNVHFDGLYDALQTRRCDIIISALPYDQTRTRDVSYTLPYFDAGEVLLVRDESDIQQVDDLDGRRVAVELGSEGHQQMLLQARNKGLELDIITVRTSEELLLVCDDASVYAIACDRVRALSYMASCSGWHISQSLTSEPYVMAVMPEAATLLKETELVLEQWQTQGYLDALAELWFSPGG